MNQTIDENLRYKDALTTNQKERMVNDAVQALEELLNCPERKDLINTITLAEPKTLSASRFSSSLQLGPDRFYVINSECGSEYECGSRREFDVKKDRYASILQEYDLTAQDLKRIQQKITR